LCAFDVNPLGCSSNPVQRVANTAAEETVSSVAAFASAAGSSCPASWGLHSCTSQDLNFVCIDSRRTATGMKTTFAACARTPHCCCTCLWSCAATRHCPAAAHLHTAGTCRVVRGRGRRAMENSILRCRLPRIATASWECVGCFCRCLSLCGAQIPGQHLSKHSKSLKHLIFCPLASVWPSRLVRGVFAPNRSH